MALFGLIKDTDTTQLQEALTAEQWTSTLLEERLAELELQMEDIGWLKVGAELNQEFSRDGLAKIIQLARLMALKNPMIDHAVQMTADYVFGQGVTVDAEADAVSEVVKDFWEDWRNQSELTSSQALLMTDKELSVTGNLFFVLFANDSTGKVLVRSIAVEEVQDIITNPEDSKEPWYYLRTWSQRTFDASSGQIKTDTITAYYPDWRYDPQDKPKSINNNEVHWESPVYHVKVGGFKNNRFGVPEVYSALDWARAFKDLLEDHATVKRAHARFAFKLTTPGGKAGVRAAKTRLGTSLGAPGAETNPAPLVGSTFVQAQGVDMEPVRTTGAQAPPEESRMLALMAGAGLATPYTMLMGDAEVGNLATAKTLDRPTELRYRTRRQLWTEVLQGILGYAVDKVALSAGGKLQGTLEGEDGEQHVVLAIDPATNEPMSRHIDVEYPSMLERSVTERINALVSAFTFDGKTDTGMFDLRTKIRLLLTALEEDDVDELLDRLAPEDQEPTQQEFAAALREAARILQEAIADDGEDAEWDEEEADNETNQEIVTLLAFLLLLIASLQKRQITQQQFTDQAVARLAQSYNTAYSTIGGGAADAEWVKVTAEAQRPYLTQFAADIQAGTATGDALSQRAALYTGPVWTAMQRGHAEAVAAQTDAADVASLSVVWHTKGDAEVCTLCEGRNGQTYTAETLPGYPGEGSFGGPICEGGPQCRCSLEWLVGGAAKSVTVKRTPPKVQRRKKVAA